MLFHMHNEVSRCERPRSSVLAHLRLKIVTDTGPYWIRHNSSHWLGCNMVGHADEEMKHKTN